MSLLADARARCAQPAPPERLYGELRPYATRWIQIGYAASDRPVARSLGRLAGACGDRSGPPGISTTR